MNRIELFDDPNFKGINGAISVRESTPDLTVHSFMKRASSLRVTGDPWIVFTEINYGGDFEMYEEGKHAVIPEFHNKIASVKVIRGGLSTPKINLYVDKDYKGAVTTLLDTQPIISTSGMDNKISSHKVESGAWILYDKEHYQGKMMAAVAGDNVPNYATIQWDDKLKSLKPFTS
ncbi:epidermal differentiation-specific protein-like [Ascaphus truei]|uniref:epidermal differentiation-specific protein-like n=1 Tax=Ascaphus truei TaxID=8439 RepID=UPI003F59EEE4